MHRAFKTFVTPLLYPTNRIRAQCLLLLALLVVSLLYLEAHPYFPLLAGVHWDATTSSFEYLALTVLCWIVVGGRSPAALVLAVSIVLLNEGMRYSSKNATAEFHHVGIDLVVAGLVVLLLSTLRTSYDRKGPAALRSMDEGCN